VRQRRSTSPSFNGYSITSIIYARKKLLVRPHSRHKDCFQFRRYNERDRPDCFDTLNCSQLNAALLCGAPKEEARPIRVDGSGSRLYVSYGMVVSHHVSLVGGELGEGRRPGSAVSTTFFTIWFVSRKLFLNPFKAPHFLVLKDKKRRMDWTNYWWRSAIFMMVCLILTSEPFSSASSP
jgi:hypothetical protein